MLNFGCSLVASKNGLEQVQAFQKYPKINIKHTYTLKSAIAERMISSLYKYSELRMPLWFEAYKYTGIIPASSLTVSFDTSERDFLEGGYAFITDAVIGEDVTDDNVVYELKEIGTVTSGGITFTEGLEREYVNPWIVPAFDTYIIANPMFYQYPEGGLIDLTIDFVLKTRLEIDSSSAETMTKFKGVRVLEKTNYFNRKTDTTTLDLNVVKTDLSSGNITAYSPRDLPPNIRAWGFLSQGYDEFRDMLKLLYSLVGRQSLMYVPTYRNEFRLTRNHVASEPYIAVLKGDFADIHNTGKNVRAVYINAPDGTFIEEIDHITEDNEYQYIYLKSPVPFELPKNNSHICWLVLSRASSDYFQIQKDTADNYTCDIGFVETKPEFNI